MLCRLQLRVARAPNGSWVRFEAQRTLQMWKEQNWTPMDTGACFYPYLLEASWSSSPQQYVVHDSMEWLHASAWWGIGLASLRWIMAIIFLNATAMLFIFISVILSRDICFLGCKRSSIISSPDTEKHLKHLFLRVINFQGSDAWLGVFWRHLTHVCSNL